jgi:hypothetical protein
MSRQVYLLGVGLALVALALAFTGWALSPPPGVTEANARRIQRGMTRTQVEALMGGLPGRVGEEWPLWPPPDPNEGLESYRIWKGTGHSIRVEFDKAGRVAEVWVDYADWGPKIRVDQARSGPLARLRAWLGW